MAEGGELVQKCIDDHQEKNNTETQSIEELRGNLDYVRNQIREVIDIVDVNNYYQRLGFSSPDDFRIALVMGLTSYLSDAEDGKNISVWELIMGKSNFLKSEFHNAMVETGFSGFYTTLVQMETIKPLLSSYGMIESMIGKKERVIIDTHGALPGCITNPTLD